MDCFFESWAEIAAFLGRLVFMRCPLCGASGALGSHGFIYGYNLQAAFATARLAVAAIGKHCGKGGFQSLEKPPKRRNRK